MKNEIKALIKEVEADKNREFSNEWLANSVNALNNYYMENGCEGDYIYDLESSEWEDIVAFQLESRGWVGVKIFLEDVDNTSNYARLDGYGNGESVDYKIKELLDDALAELNNN